MQHATTAASAAASSRASHRTSTAGLPPPSPVPAGGPNIIFSPFGSVISRECPHEPPSRARQPETVIRVADLHRDVASPADSVQRDRRITLELPIDDVALLVFDVEIDVRVRVRPLDLREHARQRDRWVDVVLGAERMVRRRRHRQRPRRWRATSKPARLAASWFPLHVRCACAVTRRPRVPIYSNASGVAAAGRTG